MARIISCASRPTAICPTIIRSLAAYAAIGLCACNGAGNFAPAPPSVTLLRPANPSLGKIRHVVIIIQENRSLNNLFYGFPGARTTTYGYDTRGRKIALQPVGLATDWDLGHSSANFFAACNGTGSIPGTNCRMNGFDREYEGCGGSQKASCPNAHPPYSYVPHSDTKPYFAIAKRYVLADEMYESNFDSSSFVSHQYAIAGQAESSVNFPLGAWGCPGGAHDDIDMVGPQRQIPGGDEVVCWNPTTLGDELDKAGLSWGYYTSVAEEGAGNWSAYQAIKHIYYGPDWDKDVITPQTRFFGDVSKGRLRTVSWITPTCPNSDHAGCESNDGPQWVASLINAIGTSKYWKSTAIFVFWDDYGGWYDPAPPAYVDYDGLGIRVPMLIVSPYAKDGHVSHVHYEHGSILKFVEDQFGLGRLAASDARALSPAKDSFDFDKPPRPFTLIPTSHGERYFLNQPIDLRPTDTE
jgi:phospholipase C